MINWLDKREEGWEGTFQSKFFHNEDEDQLFICIENASCADYAEKCVEHLNALPKEIIQEICKGIIQASEMDEAFDSPEDILNYCWFTTMYVSVPEDESKLSYILEGEGEWGELGSEVIGFVIKNNQLVYVGVDYFDYL